MSNFENVGRELSDAELSAVQGGFIGPLVKGVGKALKKGVEFVGDAIADGAKAIANGFTNLVLGEARRRLGGIY